MEKLKALVVDDTVVYRKVLTKAVEDTGVCEVLKTAPNGAIALDWIKQKQFDVVLLDVFMPELDGIETLKRIKRDYPDMPVIMISGDGNESVKNTVKALELGAMEFILKPTQDDPDKNSATITRTLKILFAQIQINQMGRQQVKERSSDIERITVSPKAPNRKMSPPVKRRTDWSHADLILIASSTGGPVALEKVMSKIQNLSEFRF